MFYNAELLSLAKCSTWCYTPKTSFNFSSKLIISTSPVFFNLCFKLSRMQELI